MTFTPRDHDLERADILLDQADALLNRHREAEAADTPSPPFGGTTAADDDLPLLTEVVDVRSPPAASPVAPADLAAEAPPIPADAPPTPADAPPAAALRATLEREIAAAVEDWLVDQLPLIVDRQIDLLVERLRAETLDELRHGLAPAIAERVLQRLDPTRPGRP